MANGVGIKNNIFACLVLGILEVGLTECCMIFM